MAVLLQQSTTEALGKLCLCSRILKEHSGSYVGTAECYWSTRYAVLV